MVLRLFFKWTPQVITVPNPRLSAPSPQPLASPGMHVGAVATVDGLKDALLGSAEGGHLFLWYVALMGSRQSHSTQTLS